MVSKPQPLVDVTPAVKQLQWQLCLLLVMTVVARVADGTLAGLSALAGAGIVVIGQAFFSYRAFRHAGAVSAKHIVQDFYRGEIGKFMLVTSLMAAVLVGFRSVEHGWLFASFILEQLVAWIVPLTIRPAQR